ncbi:hypothetical protein [Paracoccus versutus]|uniref:hypothetical protein n=1 Tax=Paracoccus versutus TaxID=34007 RepID=UPI0011C05A66|nr:hypothetical protein [Paracoccus versutus]
MTAQYRPNKSVSTMRIILKHSHACPGCRATLPDGLPDTETDVIVSFADGIEVPGRLWPSTDDRRLEIASHRTAAGALIARKAWLLRQDDFGWKIKARLSDPS